MKTYSWLEIAVLENGIVRIYGNGGVIFEACGESVKTITTMFPKQSMPSGKVVTDETKKGNQS